MPLPAETDVSSPKHLRDKYAIIGLGETTYTRGSGMTTRALGTWAVKNALEDAGLKASDVDGMLSYQSGDSTFSTFIAATSASASTSTWTCSAAAPRRRR